MHTQHTQRQGTTREYGHCHRFFPVYPPWPCISKTCQNQRKCTKDIMKRILSAALLKWSSLLGAALRFQEHKKLFISVTVGLTRSSSVVVGSEQRRFPSFRRNTQSTLFPCFYFFSLNFSLRSRSALRDEKVSDGTEVGHLRAVTGPGRCIFEINGDKIQISPGV